MPVFYNSKANLTLAQIEEIEQLYSLKFPEEYKLHLLKYNGGKCKPNVFKFTENGNLTKSDINDFLAIYDGNYDNLSDDINTYKVQEKRLPNNILPIGNDSGGNLICISCYGNDIGYVYFWDHENEIDYSVKDDSDYSNLYFVANSFNQFLDNLEEEG